MTGLLLLCLLPSQQPVRVLFDVQIFYEQRSVVAAMALNRETPDRFSISCRKSPSGTLFTYWGTESENVLWFPRADAAFYGPRGEAFGLFPGGPEMDRKAWISLLFDGPSTDLGEFRYQKSKLTRHYCEMNVSRNGLLVW